MTREQHRRGGVLGRLFRRAAQASPGRTQDSGGITVAQQRTILVACLFGLPTLLAVWTYTLLYKRDNVVLMYLPLALAAVILGVMLQGLTGRRRGHTRILVWSTVGSTFVALAYRVVSPEHFDAGLNLIAALMVVLAAVAVCLWSAPLRAGLALGLLLALYSLPLATGYLGHTLSGAPLLMGVATVLMLSCAAALLFSSTWLHLALGQSEATGQQMEYLSRTDHLTGLSNRRSLYGRIEELLAEAGSSDLRSTEDGPAFTFSLALLDIDHFKAVNDTFGHASGDTVLCGVAEILQSFMRQRDLAGRWGGEEFVLVLPGVPLEQGTRIAERLRARIEEARLLSGRRVTASFGVTGWRAGDTLEALMTRADAAMYLAKQRGRNRVVVADGGPASQAGQPDQANALAEPGTDDAASPLAELNTVS